MELIILCFKVFLFFRLDRPPLGENPLTWNWPSTPLNGVPEDLTSFWRGITGATEEPDLPPVDSFGIGVSLTSELVHSDSRDNFPSFPKGGDWQKSKTGRHRETPLNISLKWPHGPSTVIRLFLVYRLTQLLITPY